MDASAQVEAGSDVPATAEGDEAAVEANGEAAETSEASDTPVPYTLTGVGEKTVRKLVEGGFGTLEALLTSMP